MFPKSLNSYGLNQELLATVFNQVLTGKQPKWRLRGIPEIHFYKELHPFLKKWSVSCKLTKQTIGRFYNSIDPTLNAKGSRPDNVYRLIERISRSTQPPNTMMSYGTSDKSTVEVQMEASSCTKHVEAMSFECIQLREKLEVSHKQLSCARKALQIITNEKIELKKQCNTAKIKATKIKSKYEVLEDNFAQLEEDNIELSTAISDLQSELESNPDDTSDCDGDFSILTKHGRRYSPVVRKLYYTLLSKQIPSVKIADIIKTVIRCFFPAIDVDGLQLPKRSCADYMRKCELVTISNAHKATVLSECTSGYRLNTDGTTKNQKKIGGVGINDIVISVNELPDGTAASSIEDVSRELEKLRKIAQTLHLPNADQINWTLFTASSSDSASTQKHFNKLIEECRQKDELRFGAATLETVEIVESFCSMHLGVNLRKAFLSGTVQEDAVTDSSRKYHPVDKFVHEFCKLFGKHGTPEYGSGANDFPDFLALMINDHTLSDESRQYFQICSTVNLQRQVGSRYFVSASNAARIVFLAKAAVQFLHYTGKVNGNKLEVELFAKLNNVNEMAQLRADALMYYHTYADLVMLSKSKELAKSVMDMNNHYLELLCFLGDVQTSPEIVFDKTYEVFRSEKELYGPSSTVNHRHHKNVEALYNKLFEETEDDSGVLLLIVTLLKTGC